MTEPGDSGRRLPRLPAFPRLPGLPRLSTPVLAVLAGVFALAAALLLTLVVLPLRHDISHYNAQQRLDATVAVAASHQVVNFTGLNWRHASRFVRQIEANSVGAFHREALASAGSTVAAARKARSVTHPHVEDVAVISATPTAASALVIVNVQQRDASSARGSVANDRFEIDLSRSHGQWLVSGIETVG